MLRRFLKDSAIYGASNLLSRGIGLLLLPLYTRVLTPTEYGTVDLLQVLRSLVALTVALEISQGLVRFFAEAGDDGEKRVLASTALWFTLGAYAVFAVVATVWARPLSAWLLDTEAATGAWRLAVAYTVAAGVFALLQDLLRFDFRARDYALASIASLLVTTGLTVALLLGTPLRVGAIFLGLIAGQVVGIAWAGYAARGRLAPVFRPERCREMLAFSLPLVASGISIFVATFIDRIAIRQLMTVADVGVFGVAARFASVASLLMVVLQTSLTPLVYNQYRDEATPREIARILRLVAAVLLPLMVVLGVFAPEIIGLVTTRAYLDAAPLVPVLALAVVLSQFWVFAPGLGLGKRTRTIALLNGAAALLNTGLNFVLIPHLGIMGAAAATLTGAVLTATGYLLLGARYYRVPHPWPRLLTATVLGMAVALAGGVAWGRAPAAAPGIWVEKGALVLVATLVLGAILIHRHEIAQLRSLLTRRPAAP